MTEDELRVDFGDGFSASRRGGHLSWVESHATSAGFPDVDCCHLGKIAQIELKVVKAKGKIEIRPTQYRWFKDRHKAGGEPVMLIGFDDGFYVLPATSVSKPDALVNESQINERPHFFVKTIEHAIDAAFLMAEFGSSVCPR